MFIPKQKNGSYYIYIYSSSRKFIYVYTETKLVYVYTEQKTGVTIYIYIVAPENLKSAAHIEGRGIDSIDKKAAAT